MTQKEQICALWLTACLLLSPAVLAQTGQGTIVGLVDDSTSAMVRGANVTLTHEDSGFTYILVTNEEALYRVPYLNPGTYRATYEAPGFKKLVRGGIRARCGSPMPACRLSNPPSGRR